MRDPAQRFGPWVVGALLAWSAWSGLSEEGEKKAPEKKRAAEIPVARLARRAEGEALRPFRDPFFTDWAPYGPTHSPEYLAEQKRRAQEAEKQAIREATEADAARKAAARAAVDAARSRGPQSVTVTVDSVARLPDGDVARISGHTVRVGEPVPDLGVDPAPILVRVDGTACELQWGARTYTVRIEDGATTLVRRDEDPSAAKPEEERAQ